MAVITNSSSYMQASNNLYLKFGPTKMGPQQWGDYVVFGPNRVIDGVVDMTQVTNGNTLIVSDVVFFPALATGQLFIEKVEAIAETALTTGTSFKFGLIQTDRSTVPTNYDSAFINGEVIANLNAVGKFVTYTAGSSAAGGLLGSAPASATGPYYLTVTGTGTWGAGKLRLRVYYHGVDGVSITQ